MKKIFKKLKLRDLILLIVGLIIGGSIGITATTYVLKSSEIQYTNDKSVQQAIDELYILAENVGGSNETLPIGTAVVDGFKVTIPYTGSYDKIICAYGTDENYGKQGTISDNTCVFRGTSANQKLYYKVSATTLTNNAEGKVYETSGSISTENCTNIEDSGVCITTTTYTTGDAVTLGGYNWHVISDTGTNLTLLMDMDANKLGSNSNMAHTSSYYATYSWDKSLIRTYLNGTFLTNLQSNINNDIVSTEICADPSKTDGTTYGGYLISELTALGKTSSCSTKVNDKVRLISLSEYYNMSPKYTSTDNNYPNVGNYITKISKLSDYSSWLYCNSSACGDSIGEWWTMGSLSTGSDNYVPYAHIVPSHGDLDYLSRGNNSKGVRPVITIVK